MSGNNTITETPAIQKVDKSYSFDDWRNKTNEIIDRFNNIIDSELNLITNNKIKLSGGGVTHFSVTGDVVGSTDVTDLSNIQLQLNLAEDNGFKDTINQRFNTLEQNLTNKISTNFQTINERITVFTNGIGNNIDTLLKERYIDNQGDGFTQVIKSDLNDIRANYFPTKGGTLTGQFKIDSTGPKISLKNSDSDIVTSPCLIESINKYNSVLSSIATFQTSNGGSAIEFYNTEPGDKQLTRQKKVFKIDEEGELWTKNQGKLKDYYSSLEFAKKVRVLAYAGL